MEEFIVMDIDIIRDQKLGVGAGTRSNKVCVVFIVEIQLIRDVMISKSPGIIISQ